MIHVAMFSTKKIVTEDMIMTNINITINLEDLRVTVEKSSLESPIFY
jgi:putative transposase